MGPLAISSTVNLNWATNSPKDRQKQVEREIYQVKKEVKAGMRLTFFLVQHTKRLQELMFGTLHHSQTSLSFILKCPAGHKDYFVYQITMKSKPSIYPPSFKVIVLAFSRDDTNIEHTRHQKSTALF